MSFAEDQGLVGFVGAVFLLAGFVKGVIGLGLPTVSIGLLSVALAPADAAALLMLPSILTNLWQMLAGSHFVPLVRRLWSMMAGIVAGTWLASSLVASAGNGFAALVLGLALVGYAVLGLAAVRFAVPRARELVLSPVIGLATGVITAATATFVIPGTLYLQALGLEKDELVQAMGLSFTVSTLALAPVLMRTGALHGGLLMPSLLALGAALAGMVGGQLVRERISAVAFRRWFFIGLLVLGAHLIWRSVAG